VNIFSYRRLTKRKLSRAAAERMRAESLMFFVEQLFSSTDRDFESVLKRRQWTRPILIVGTIWVIGHIEVKQEPTAGQRFRFEIAACRIGFFSRERIHKGQKESIRTLINRQLGLLPVHAETESAVTKIDLDVPG
jgi:hypothetical protein